MGRTFIRQGLQIQASQSYDATLAPGATLQTGAQSIEDDLNALRSQMNRVLDATLGGSWTDPIYTTPDGKQRSIKQVNVGLDGIETKPWLNRVQVLAPITVPAGQNYVILSVAGNQAPTIPLAFGSSTLGALAAPSASSGAAFAANELTATDGANAISPKNLVRVRYASGGQSVESQDLDVMGLLQVESTATDGGAFNDTSGGNRVKISFVTIDYSNNVLQPCAASDVGGKSLNYLYTQRQQFGTLSEQATLSDGGFVDNIGDLDVTLTRGAANQSGPIPSSSTLQWQMASGTSFSIQDAAGAHTLAQFAAATGANAVTFAPDSVLFNTTNPPVSKKGFIVGQAAQAINLGVTAGQIDSGGPLNVLTTVGGLNLQAAGSLNLKDGNQAASTWVGSGIPLSASTADWNTYKADFGELSLLAGTVAAANNGNSSVLYANVTAASIPAGTNVSGAGAGAVLDQQLFNYSGVNFLTKVRVYVNGQLQRPGTNAAAGNDYYPGTAPTNGDLTFSYALQGTTGHPDVICMEIRSSALYNS